MASLDNVFSSLFSGGSSNGILLLLHFHTHWYREFYLFLPNVWIFLPSELVISSSPYGLRQLLSRPSNTAPAFLSMGCKVKWYEYVLINFFQYWGPVMTFTIAQRSNFPFLVLIVFVFSWRHWLLVRCSKMPLLVSKSNPFLLNKNIKDSFQTAMFWALLLWIIYY